MTEGSILRAISSSLEEPAELGVNAIVPLRVYVEEVAVADLGGEGAGVLLLRRRPRPRLSGGPEEME